MTERPGVKHTSRSKTEPLDAAAEQLRASLKQILRKKMKAVRRQIPESARRDRERRLYLRLDELDEVQSARSIGAYLAVRSELDLKPWMQQQTGNIEFAIPRVVPETGALCFHEWNENQVSSGAFGIEEPSQHTPQIDVSTLDVLLVPGLAFDEAGHRIGWGKGYYDRLLSKPLRAFTVGVSFDFQLVAEVPTLPSDMPVDAIVTGQRVIRCAG
ncbi:MAG: 5-formyltetrahydrofolate cyclo-ligase [Myxococcota bacterium]